MSSTTSSTQPGGGVNKFYFAAWRWHFYAGLYVIPFFIMLAVTGLMMLWLAFLDGRDGERYVVVAAGTGSILGGAALVVETTGTDPDAALADSRGDKPPASAEGTKGGSALKICTKYSV